MSRTTSIIGAAAVLTTAGIAYVMYNNSYNNSSLNNEDDSCSFETLSTTVSNLFSNILTNLPTSASSTASAALETASNLLSSTTSLLMPTSTHLQDDLASSSIANSPSIATDTTLALPLEDSQLTTSLNLSLVQSLVSTCLAKLANASDVASDFVGRCIVTKLIRT